MPTKKFIIVTCCLLFSQIMVAQFKVGVSAGINLANLKEKENDEMITRSFLPRVNAGVELGYYFDGRWGLQSGAFYAGKGYRIRLEDNFDSVIVRFNYFEMPLKLAYRLKDDKENWVIVSGGGYAAYGFKGKETYTGSPDRTQDPFIVPGYNRFDFGYIIESAFGIKNNFAAKVGYSHGLKSLRDPEDKMKNFLINASLMYFFK